MIRSFLVVLGSYVLVMIVVLATTLLAIRLFLPSDVIMPSFRETPAYLSANLLFSVIAALLGGWAAARMAHQQPLAHALALAGLMFGVAMFSLLQGVIDQPAWYGLVLALVMPLVALLGGWLRTLNIKVVDWLLLSACVAAIVVFMGIFWYYRPALG